mgnify:FL=1
MEIFATTKQFPPEEKYSLAEQIRRSSRSVCACLAEAYLKKKYPAHFSSKLSDADMENSETGVWLDFSASCHYCGVGKHHEPIRKNEEIGRLLDRMINFPDN